MHFPNTFSFSCPRGVILCDVEDEEEGQEDGAAGVVGEDTAATEGDAQPGPSSQSVPLSQGVGASLSSEPGK